MREAPGKWAVALLPIIITGVCFALLGSSCRKPSSETTKPKGVVRIDIRKDLAPISPNSITGFFVIRNGHPGVQKNTWSRNIFEARTLYHALMNATTTDEHLISQGSNMHLLTSSSRIGLTYLYKGKEEKASLPIVYQDYEGFFGPECGPLIQSYFE